MLDRRYNASRYTFRFNVDYLTREGNAAPARGKGNVAYTLSSTSRPLTPITSRTVFSNIALFIDAVRPVGGRAVILCTSLQSARRVHHYRVHALYIITKCKLESDSAMHIHFHSSS